MMNIADHIIPPIAGKIGVQTLSGSAGNRTQLFALEDVVGQRYVTFIADVDFYILFGSADNDTETPAPVIATTGDISTTTKNGRCLLVPAKVPFPTTVDQSSRYFRVIGSGAGTLRYYVSSTIAPPFGR